MPTTTKLDMKRDLTPLYAPSTDPVLVEVPPLRYLTIDGVIPEGDTGPGTDPGFQEAIGALYGVTYTLKFESKASGRDFVVMPLEGLFWADGTEDAPPVGASPMRWTLMIVQPPWITQDAVSNAAGALVEKRKVGRFPSLKLDTLTEGQAAQPRRGRRRRSCTSDPMRKSTRRSRSCSPSSRSVASGPGKSIMNPQRSEPDCAGTAEDRDPPARWLSEPTR
jgi:hypothetical protein